MMNIPGWPIELTENLYSNKLLWDKLRTVDKSKIVPCPTCVLEAFLLPLDKVKVLIIGQDPYIRGEAHGLAFSSQTSITPSLEIIFKELYNDLGIQRRNTNLIDWAEQGVLLLNSILTTEIGKSLAHEHFGWQDFTSKAIQLVLSRDKPLVVMLWGTYAKEAWRSAIKTQQGFLYLSNKIITLSSNHPVAEHRNPNGKYLFTGNKHFSQANNWLVKQGLEPIKW